MSQNRVSPSAQSRLRRQDPPASPAQRPAPRPAARPAQHPGPYPGAEGTGVGPLTGLGVSLVLLAACVCGALLDLLLVGTADWAVTALYIAACGYTAYRVRGADWYAALVAPPLTFAVSMILLAKLMPESFGSGLLGLAATTFELLAAKAKALFLGTVLSAAVLAVRRVRTARPTRR